MRRHCPPNSNSSRRTRYAIDDCELQCIVAIYVRDGLRVRVRAVPCDGVTVVTCVTCVVLVQALKTEGARRVTQEMHEQEYQQALVTIKDKIRDTEGPDMKESMQDQIRQWFIEVR